MDRGARIRLDLLLWTHSRQGYVLARGVSLGADLSASRGAESMPTRSEVVAESAEWAEEALGVLGGFEALEHPLALARRQVRILGSVVQAFMPSMLGVQQDAPEGLGLHVPEHGTSAPVHGRTPVVGLATPSASASDASPMDRICSIVAEADRPGRSGRTRA